MYIFSLQNSRRRAIRGLLHVSGDGLRVVDDDTKGLIVDQTIEKVSFCAPDRIHERGFSYICRDGTTRRWMCHGFLASKDSGERLSHAVGCAFAVCLERKQRRDTECGVTMTFDTKNSTFTRSGSFRTQTMTERLQNNERGIDIGGGLQAAIVTPQPKPHNPFAIDRPHATPMILERLERQGSFRAVSNQSPFKRQMSLRINDLPSNAERQKAFLDPRTNVQHMRTVSPIPEVSPNKQQSDNVAQLCQELSQGLSLLTRTDENDDLNFNNIMITNQNKSAIPSSLIGSPIIPSVFPNTVSSFPSSTFSNSTALPSAHVQPFRIKSDDLSPIKTVEPFASITDSSYKSTNSSASVDLPKPEQWLAGQIVQSTSPAPRRPPSFGMESRTKSLNNASDPFDAEWVAGITKTTDEATADLSINALPSIPQQNLHHNTNPFISPPKPPAQSFQVQL